MLKKSELKQVVYGAYVATPIPNAFNNKVAYWLSKRGCMFSMYMFSVDCLTTKTELKDLLSKTNVKSYALMLEERMMRKYDSSLYLELAKLVDSGFDWENDDLEKGLEMWREYAGAFTNLSILSCGTDPDVKEPVLSWQQLGEFLHYLNRDRLKNVLTYLRENGYISYKELKNGIKELQILKQM